eukprot:6289816-Prymnesium_polylepis.1
MDMGLMLTRPVDGLFLEVVAKAPAAEHLEKGVVVRVHAHVLEVVVLAAGADALLGVGRALQACERTARLRLWSTRAGRR